MKKRICLRIDDTLFNDLSKIATDESIDFSKLIRKALTKYVSETNNKFSYFENLLNEQNNNKEKKMLNIFKNKNKNGGLITKDGKHYRTFLGDVSSISEEEFAEMELDYERLLNEDFDKFQEWVNNNDPKLIEKFMNVGYKYSNYVDIVKYNHLTIRQMVYGKIVNMAVDLENENDFISVYKDICISRMIKMDDKFSYTTV